MNLMRININEKKMNRDELIFQVTIAINHDLAMTYYHLSNSCETLKRAEITPSTKAAASIEAMENNLNGFDEIIDTISDALRRSLLAQKPIRTSGVFLCPSCNHRVNPRHSYCHRCGQKLIHQRCLE